MKKITREKKEREVMYLVSNNLMHIFSSEEMNGSTSRNREENVGPVTLLLKSEGVSVDSRMLIHETADSCLSFVCSVL